MNSERKALRELDLDTLAAVLDEAFPTQDIELAARLIRGEVEPDTVPAAERWIRQCYNRPNDAELLMAALDGVLEGFGVEAITREGDVFPRADYVNMGDTYAATIVRDIETGELFLTSWGDVVEAIESEVAR